MTTSRLTIQPLQPASLDGALAVADAALGTDYISTAALTAPGVEALVAVSADRVHGLARGWLVTAADAADPLPGAIEAHLPRPWGYVASVAVEPARQGLGAGSLLLGALLDRLRQRGARGFAMLGWRQAGRVNIDRLARRHGFHAADEIEHAWRSASLREGFCCLDCGAPPCECAAVAYLRLEPTGGAWHGQR